MAMTLLYHWRLFVAQTRSITLGDRSVCAIEQQTLRSGPMIGSLLGLLFDDCHNNRNNDNDNNNEHCNETSAMHEARLAGNSSGLTYER